ncbi:MAG TPA: hypothetical protein VF753_10575 [Terriglobales bacterium]
MALLLVLPAVLVAASVAQQIANMPGTPNPAVVLTASSTSPANAAMSSNGVSASTPSPAVVAVPQSSPSVREDLPSYSPWPRPIFEGGLSLLHGGYDPAAANVGAGVNLEMAKFLAVAEISADDAHKTTSDSGYDAYFQARAFVRVKRDWFAGGGGQWNQLTANVYSKQAWRPAIGGGKDFFGEDLSARAQLLYVFAGDDHQNGSQGPEFSLWLPSPALHRHFFYHQTLGIYQSHQTSVPGNSGTNDHFMSLFAGFTLMYRF